MNFFDDIRMRVEQAAQGEVKNFQGYIQNNIVDPLVRVGQAARGNLTEEQLKEGQSGAPKPIAPSQSIADGLVSSAGMSPVILLGLGVAAYFLFFAKK